jgi:hypothetical protein
LKRLIWILLLACDVTPLTRTQLFGPDAAPAPDAVAPDVTAPDVTAHDTSTPDTSPPDTAPDPSCTPRSRDGLFSGAVVDVCNGAVLDANVGIGGQHLCTFAQKGSFFFSNLPVGCNLTVSVTREGYRPYYATVVIQPGGLSSYMIHLERTADPQCQGAQPIGAACRCDVPGCVTAAP